MAKHISHPYILEQPVVVRHVFAYDRSEFGTTDLTIATIATKNGQIVGLARKRGDDQFSADFGAIVATRRARYELAVSMGLAKKREQKSRRFGKLAFTMQNAEYEEFLKAVQDQVEHTATLSDGYAESMGFGHDIPLNDIDDKVNGNEATVTMGLLTDRPETMKITIETIEDEIPQADDDFMAGHTADQQPDGRNGALDTK